MIQSARDTIAAGLTEAVELARASPRAPTLAEMPIGTLLHPADFYRVLEEACEAAGGQSAWARRHGIPRQQVSDVVRARRDPGPAILRALGLQAVQRYAKVRTVNG